MDCFVCFIKGIKWGKWGVNLYLCMVFDIIEKLSIFHFSDSEWEPGLDIVLKPITQRNQRTSSTAT